MLRDIRYLGHEIIERRISAYDIDCDLKHGWMEVAARPRHMQAIREHVGDMIEEGHGDYLELIEPGDMGARAWHGRLSWRVHQIGAAAISTP